MTKTSLIPATGALALLILLGNIAAANPVSSAKKSTDSATGLGVTGSGSYSIQPDPKHPGKLLWKIWAKDFSLQAPGQQVEGTLLGVSALLFQNGVPAATLTAPKAQGDYTHRVIVATGGVHMKSLTQPGTTLQCDKLIWQATTAKIVALGHVVYRNGKTGTTIVTPQLTADTVLKTISSSVGGRVTLPKGF